MERGTPGIKIFTIIGLAIAGMFLVSILTLACIFAVEGNLSATLASLQDASFTENSGLTRAVLFIQHLGMFILPALVFGIIFYKQGIRKGFDLQEFPDLKILGLGVAFIFVALPLVNLSFLLNEQIILPEWASIFEAQANETLQSVLQMDHFGIFLINFLLIAVVPGIGEELIFRGIIQKYFGRLVGHPIFGIWFAAILFSAIHMQFEGFFPRMVLGAILGYLYYWTNNLWVPIIAHLANNGLQVTTLYISDVDLSTIENTPQSVTWWMVLGSVGLLYLIATYIQSQKTGNVRIA